MGLVPVFMLAYLGVGIENLICYVLHLYLLLALHTDFMITLI